MTDKTSCIHYDEAEKRLNDGLPCRILKGRYHTKTGTGKHTNADPKDIEKGRALEQTATRLTTKRNRGHCTTEKE